jgi:hypothetical protein
MFPPIRSGLGVDFVASNVARRCGAGKIAPIIAQFGRFGKGRT